MHQRGLDSGVLRTWTKSFKTTGVEGEDAVQMLRDAFKRRGENLVEVVAILNDTTGKYIVVLTEKSGQKPVFLYFYFVSICLQNFFQQSVN